MADLRQRLGVSYLFISHDISTVRAVCDDIVVLYAGRKVESGSRAALSAPPYHPYADLLIASVPELHTGWLEGLPPRVTMPIVVSHTPQAAGLCPFLDRCPLRVTAVCDRLAPPRQRFSSGKEVLCHREAQDLARFQLTTAITT